MPNNSTRILLFSTAFRPFIGGSELAIEEIAKRLHDFNFDIITPRYTRKLPKTEETGNVCIHRVGWGWLGDKFLFPVAGFFKARELADQEVEPLTSKNLKWTAVHAYQASYGGGAAYLFKLFNRSTKFILTLQEGKDLSQQGFWVNFFRKRIIEKADLITAISNYLKDYARKLNKKTKIVVIPNGVDLKNFRREYSYGELSELADRFGIKPGEKVITTVSRLVPKNGIDILIEAFRILDSKFQIQNSKLLIIGDGPERKNLESGIRNLELEDKVIFAGSISHAELPKYLKISDVFVRSSRSEGLGSAFLEAMAAGVPIIGTAVGGITDFLKNKETGLITKIEDPVDLAEKIYSVLKDNELAERLKKNAGELVVEKYDWDRIAGQFRELYESSR